MPNGGVPIQMALYWLDDEALQPAYSMRVRVKADFEF
jgi:hypothetical protein